MRGKTIGFSVLISVYKKEQARHLEVCLLSIVNQTRRPNEIILVEDGPIGQELEEVITDFKKQLNIFSVKLPVNKGLASALNEGLKHCTFELVIRMDSDDICLPNRFRDQIEYMTKNTEISFSSGVIEEYDDNMDELLYVKKLPLEHEELLKFAKSRSPMSHPATIYRKSAVQSVGGYPLMYPEDYALWCLMIHNGYKMGNLSVPLIKFRGGNSMISRRGPEFLLGYIQTCKMMRRIGLINNWEFITNVARQAVVRLSPVFIRRLLYRHARN